MFDKNDFYARTMHTPDDPSRARLRAALREISQVLIPLHRTLIHAAKADYAFGYENVSGPGHLLRLLDEHPFFAWLKPLTALIVDIDEMARVDFEEAEFDRIAERIELLFGTTPDPAFAEPYVRILQQNVDVAMHHGALRQTILRIEGERG
ncbi:MAG TPA: hypothetical protein VNL91_01935 [Thermoanaerobaculia bacterium]|nr:hypothetical protein [Thermoanaerobaculia bacterium]